MINSFQKALLSLGPQKSGQKCTFFKRKKKKKGPVPFMNRLHLLLLQAKKS